MIVQKSHQIKRRKTKLALQQTLYKPNCHLQEVSILLALIRDKDLSPVIKVKLKGVKRKKTYKLAAIVVLFRI